MKRKIGIGILATFIVGAFMSFGILTPNAHADIPAITAAWNQDAADEIDRLSPGTTVTSLGTRLLGPLTRGSSSVTTGGSQDLDTDAANVFYFTTSASQGTYDATFENGVTGRVVTFVLVTDNGNTVDITPVTSTGFSSVILQDANDSCSFKYDDDTNGWFLLSNNGCTIN